MANYEPDDRRWRASAYSVRGYRGVAWYVLGWEMVPDEDTEWSGMETRTGRIIVRMVGDDRHFVVEPEDATPLRRRDYCGTCGQIGCGHDGR